MEERSLVNDLNFGMTNEMKVYGIIKKFWEGKEIKNTKEIYNDKYCKWDFESDDGIKWELKSRRNTKTKYPTTIIPEHKIIEGDKDYYFVFYFTDCCSYIKYEKELFNTFKTKMVSVFRKGGNPLPIAHIEIPINLLVDIK